MSGLIPIRRTWILYTTALLAIGTHTPPLYGATPEYRAGVATVEITPREPIRLSGYGSRTRPSMVILSFAAW